MKYLILPLIFMLAATAIAKDAEPYRTFTDEQGRSIEAVIVRTGPEQIWIRRDDGRTFRISRTKFSRADREYISAWEQADALSAPNALEFSARRYSEGTAQTERTRSRQNTRERFGYVVTLTNNSPIDLTDLDIEYRFFVWEWEGLDQTGQNRSLRAYPGLASMDNLPSRGSGEFKTDTATLRSTRLRAGWSNSSTSNRQTHDDLRGVWVKISQNGQLIAEFSAPSNLKKNQNW